MTHCKSLKPACRSRPMVGRATLTMVTSSRAMKRPKQVAASAHQRCAGALPRATGREMAADMGVPSLPLDAVLAPECALGASGADHGAVLSGQGQILLRYGRATAGW